MKLPLINNDTFESHKSLVERGEFSYIEYRIDKWKSSNLYLIHINLITNDDYHAFSDSVMIKTLEILYIYKWKSSNPYLIRIYLTKKKKKIEI